MASRAPGKIGHQMEMKPNPKDELGFDKEMVERCSSYWGVPTREIKALRKHRKKVRDELSGEKNKRAKDAVTLTKFSWD